MDRNKLLSIGFSPCPNDTFIFNGLVHKTLGNACALFDTEVLADVETLNQWAMQGKLDVTKLSFHALGHVLDTYTLLQSGGALGRGCGPLLVAREKFSRDDLPAKKIAIPGRYTTAAMLLGMFAPECANLVVLPFEKIMPSIVAKEVDGGVIIHESRFTYLGYGLHCVQDLGAWWEDVSGHPIPLGGIVAKRSLGKELIQNIDQCIRKSVQWAFANREQAMAYIRTKAQELDDNVICEHINLYVNSFSEGLGSEGLAAVEDFLERGRQAGVLPESSFPVTEFISHHETRHL